MYRVEKEKDFRLLQVGTQTAFTVVDTYECVIPEFTLQQNKENLISYLKRIGIPQAPVPVPWKGVQIQKNVDFADFLQLARLGAIAELSLFAISQNSAMRVSKDGGKVPLPAEPLALLRCNTELQSHIIASLYE